MDDLLFWEDVDVAKAVREMHSQKAETIIVIKETRPVEIVTDSNILDNVDERRLPSNITKVYSIFSRLILAAACASDCCRSPAPRLRG